MLLERDVEGSGPWTRFMKTLVHIPALPLSVDLTKDLISKPPSLSSQNWGFHKAVACEVMVSRVWLARSMCSVCGGHWSFQGSARQRGKQVGAWLEVNSGSGQLRTSLSSVKGKYVTESLSSPLFGKYWVRRK